jgi:FAD/FMN-containing dehydrogenase
VTRPAPKSSFAPNDLSSCPSDGSPRPWRSFVDSHQRLKILRQAFEQFLDAAIALGGTVTGEHGVGILKRDGMRRELDPGSLALQAAVRQALDPREVFNPGKG